MAKTAKRKYTLKPFESRNPLSDTTANIAHSMLISPAWRDLSPKQQTLYLVCKDQRYTQKSKNKPVQVDDTIENEVFAMNTALYCDQYALYSRDNKKGFYRDMEALINHGFIDCFHRGKYSRSAYRYSARWINWKPGDIAPESAMTEAMKKQYQPDKEST